MAVDIPHSIAKPKFDQKKVSLKFPNAHANVPDTPSSYILIYLKGVL